MVPIVTGTVWRLTSIEDRRLAKEEPESLNRH